MLWCIVLLLPLCYIQRTEATSTDCGITTIYKESSTSNAEHNSCQFQDESGTYFIGRVRFKWQLGTVSLWPYLLGCVSFECNISCFGDVLEDTKTFKFKQKFVYGQPAFNVTPSMKCVGIEEYAMGPGPKVFSCGKDGWYPAVIKSEMCKSCDEGTEYNKQLMSCKTCQKGTYYNSTSKQCHLCPKGTYAESEASTSCTTCPKGTYAESEGSTSCTTCARGRTTPHEGSEKCDYCPAGYRTYKNTCNGPVLYGYSEQETFRVGYTDLGNLKNGIRKWSSWGNWYIFKNINYSKKRGIITEKFTKGYSNPDRKISRKNIIKSVIPLIKNVYCYDPHKPQDYKGYITKTVSGKTCLRSCKMTMSGPICRATGEMCDVPKCKPSPEPGMQCQYKDKQVKDLDPQCHVNKHLILSLEVSKETCNQLGYMCSGVMRLDSDDNWLLFDTFKGGCTLEDTAEQGQYVKVKERYCAPTQYFE